MSLDQLLIFSELSPEWDAEDVTNENSVLSYEDVLHAFFRMHDATARGRSRQYASIIFTHDEAQHELAQRALSGQPRAAAR